MSKERLAPSAPKENIDGWVSKLDFRPIFDFEINKSVIGLYQGRKKVPKIQSILHDINIDGMDFSFYGCGSLDHQLKDVEAGTQVKIFYCGKKLAKIEVNGIKIPKEIHNYVVYTKEV